MWAKAIGEQLVSVQTAPWHSHVPLPQFALDVTLIKDVPLVLFHQEHDDCSVMTTIAPVKHSHCYL